MSVGTGGGEDWLARVPLRAAGHGWPAIRLRSASVPLGKISQSHASSPVRRVIVGSPPAQGLCFWC